MRVAINGFGRIGRLAFKLMERDSFFEIVAINDLSGPKQLAYLLKYDTNYGNYKLNEISYNDDELIVGNKIVKVFKEMDPMNLPWKELDIDLVIECTGKFTKYDDAMKHIESGAKKVLISAPGKGDIKTIVFNVNDDILDGTEKIVSAASCTTNCLAPVLKVLDDNFDITRGLMTTIHAYTNDQVILDVAHNKDIEERRCRAAATNIIPTSTGAAKAIGEVIPKLKGKLDGASMRVPISTGSLIDLVLEFNRKVSVTEINQAFIDNRNETINITFDPIVSSDIIASHYGATVDGLLTKVQEIGDKQLIKVVAWYDNELGYTSQMIRLAKKI